VESEETSIARQRFGKQVSSATDTQATTEELLGTTFSVRSMQYGYKKKGASELECSGSTPCGGGFEYLQIALRIVGSGEKGTQCLVV
jgi:hypothetical protein